MLSKEEKKAAIKSFKEKKIARGIYAVRCTQTGQAWVGATRNLDATRNSTWSSLTHGAHRDQPLQAEWNAKGESAFEYAILETLEEDTNAILIPDLLKEGKRRWLAELNAQPLL